MKTYISALILSLSFSAVTHAQQSDLALRENDTIKSEENDTVKRKSAKILDEVYISANQNKLAGKHDIKPIDLPQSLQVIGAKTIEQQQTIRLSEVIKNVNGVYVGSARGGAQESFWSRGYDMSANNMFKNGFRSNGGSMPEVASLEKVEALKGSAALLFGNVAPGGIINLVTKSPSFFSGGEISMQSGSYSYYKPTLDFYGPLNSVIAYRVIGSFETAESFRDHVDRKRYYINPSVLFKASEKTDILLQGDYLRDYWTPDFGTGAYMDKIIDLPRNTYLGTSWAEGLTTQATVAAQVRHKLNDNWKLNFNTSLQDYGRSSLATERIQPKADGTLNRALGKNNNQELIIGQQVNLQGTFKTGSVKHQFFSGIDSEHAFARAFTYAFRKADGTTVTTYDTVNIFDPSTYAFENEGPIPAVFNTKIAKTTTDRIGVYAQDLISVTEKIKVLAGIRWSWQESQVKNYNEKKGEYTPENDPNPKKDPKRIDKAFTPKLGVVYQPIKNISLFASYANSFTPNTGFDVNGKTLEASIIDQYEVGVKNDFWKGYLSTNVTVYQITNSNLAQMSPVKADGTTNSDANIKTLSGETTSKGVEVDITARPIEGLSIIAGYSYNDMRYTKTSGLTGSFYEGDRLVRTPQNTGNLSFFYSISSGLLKGFTFGSIANYIGDRLGGWNKTVGQTDATRIPIPVKGYATVDASVGYNWNQFSLLCKVSNITNELNYTVHENYSVNPIAPRQIMTSLKYKF